MTLWCYSPILRVFKVTQSIGFRPYDTEWRACRKLEHAALNPTSVKQYRTLQEKCAAMLASDIIDEPTKFYELARL